MILVSNCSRPLNIELQKPAGAHMVLPAYAQETVEEDILVPESVTEFKNRGELTVFRKAAEETKA